MGMRVIIFIFWGGCEEKWDNIGLVFRIVFDIRRGVLKKLVNINWNRNIFKL